MENHMRSQNTPAITGVARPHRLPLLLAVSLPLLAAGALQAAEPQAQAPCPPGSQDVDCKPTPRSATPPDEQVTEDGKSGSTSADPDLSDRLSESRGIVTPPPTGDTEIHRPVPSEGAGRTPVIPPPGSPGGDPTVVPK
jgi:hypothetical protein